MTDDLRAFFTEYFLIFQKSKNSPTHPLHLLTMDLRLLN